MTTNLPQVYNPAPDKAKDILDGVIDKITYVNE